MFYWKFFTAFVAHILFCCAMSSLTMISLHVENLGGSKVDMGYVNSMITFGSLVACPFWGIFLDRVGRKIAFLASCLFIPCGFYIYTLLNSLHLLFFINTFLLGAAFGCGFTTFFTYIGDICPREKMVQGLALFGISGFIGMGGGPGVAQFLVSMYNFDFLFYSVILVSLIALLLCCFLPESHSRGEKQKRIGIMDIIEMATDAAFLPFWAVTLLCGCSLACHRTFIAPLCQEFQLGSISYFFISYSAAGAILRILASGLPDRLGRIRVMIPSLFLFGIGHLIVGTIVSNSGLVIGGVLGGLGHSYIFPIANALILQLAGDHRRGIAVGCFMLFMDIGGIVGSVFMGYVADYMGLLWVFRNLSLFIFLITIWVMISVPTKENKR